MFCPRWLLAATGLAALLSVGQAPVWGQQEPATPGQVIAKDLEAIDSADRRSPAVSSPPTSKAHTADKVAILPTQPTEIQVAPSAPNSVEVVNPDFTSCAIKELQQRVPELRGLKAARGQEQLAVLLDKVGAKIVELAQETPDLISREAVVGTQQGTVTMRQDFSYLILTRPRGPDVVILQEFRVDLETGEKLISGESKSAAAPGAPASPSGVNLPPLSQQLGAWKSKAPPLSQGFAGMWVYFYPLNRSESAFRYLGRQKMDGRRTLVLAFAQKPASVRAPVVFLLEGESIPVFFQGVAWVDASDFRIVRLRSDLLSPLTAVALNQLTADVKFAETPVAGVPKPLWLPRDVEVIAKVRGMVLRDKHKYSDYRAFRVQVRMLSSP